MGYSITKKFHDRKVRELNETIECLENNHASLVQSIEENHREQIEAKDNAISAAKQLADKRKVEIDGMRDERDNAAERHDAVRDRLHQLLDQIRRIPVDADREYILRAIGLVEGLVGEIAGAMPVLYTPQKICENIFHPYRFDHHIDGAKYWTEKNRYPKATDRI
jgi:hypothetical protein